MVVVRQRPHVRRPVPTAAAEAGARGGRRRLVQARASGRPAQGVGASDRGRAPTKAGAPPGGGHPTGGDIPRE